MIRFHSLSLQNFHLAKELTIPFSTDPKRPLSLIRAEPGTGKTTVFRAFRWVLYDEDGLPNAGKGYPLASMAHDPADSGPSVEVAVTLEFEHVDGEDSTSYRLRRFTTETIREDGTHARLRSETVLMRLRSAGWSVVDHPEITIERLFPAALRDIFFTDGDEAMRFIAKDVSTSTKRERVRGAIRNLLGINTLEDAEDHLDKVAAQFNSEVRTKGATEDLKTAGEQVGSLEASLAAATHEAGTIALRYKDTDEARSVARERLDAALQRGNRSELKSALADAESGNKDADADISLSIARRATSSAKPALRRSSSPAGLRPQGGGWQS